MTPKGDIDTASRGGKSSSEQMNAKCMHCGQTKERHGVLPRHSFSGDVFPYRPDVIKAGENLALRSSLTRKEAVELIEDVLVDLGVKHMPGLINARTR